MKSVFEPRPNDRNISMQYIATLLCTACCLQHVACNMLLGHPVATCCDMLGGVKFEKNVKFCKCLDCEQSLFLPHLAKRARERRAASAFSHARVYSRAFCSTD